MRRFVLALAFLLAAPLNAAIFRATLHKVWDGDTIDVVDERGREFRIRLSGIDAPERDQPFGQLSGESLRRLLSAGPLIVDAVSVDRYQRVLAKITCAGRDAGVEQIRSGFAWFYRWTDSISQSDRVLYAREEQAARSLHRGLWADRDPIPPWQFRRTESVRWPPSFAAPRPVIAAESSASRHGVVILADPRLSSIPAFHGPVVTKRRPIRKPKT
jgi:endonuclease YncB( thermonuclease family)